MRGKYVDSVQTRDIPQFIEDARDALDFYFKYKKYGPPFSGGWTTWPEYAIVILEIYNTIDWLPERDK